MQRPDERTQVASRRIRHFAVLSLAALVTLQLPLPWGLVTLLFATLAVVIGVRALVAARKAGMRSLVTVAVSAGVGFTALLVVSLLTVVALWPLQLELQECQRGALTISAKHACQADFEQGVQDRLQEMLNDGG